MSLFFFFFQNIINNQFYLLIFIKILQQNVAGCCGFTFAVGYFVYSKAAAVGKNEGKAISHILTASVDMLRRNRQTNLLIDVSKLRRRFLETAAY